MWLMFQLNLHQRQTKNLAGNSVSENMQKRTKYVDLVGVGWVNWKVMKRCKQTEYD